MGNAEHQKEYAHPGDSDWDSSVLCMTTAAESTSASDAPIRQCCRYGAQFYRKSAEHRDAYAHPGDPDWERASGSQGKAKPGNDVQIDDEQALTCNSHDLDDLVDSSVWDEVPKAESNIAWCSEISQDGPAPEQQVDCSRATSDVRYDPESGNKLTFNQLVS